MPSVSEVRVARSKGRATVSWRRSPLNVFDLELLDQLARALGSDPVRSAHVVVLHGSDHHWSAGLAVEDHLVGRVDRMFRSFRALLGALAAVPAPTVAQVEGRCLGGGLELLAACDLAYASSDATFGQPEIRLGVFPPLAASDTPRALAPKHAAELLYLGETVEAARAEAIGLVSRVFPAGTLAQEVDRVADKLVGMRAESLRLLKQAMRPDPPLLGAPFDRAERLYLEQLVRLPQPDEGLRAFLEKRPANWPAPER